MPNEHPERVSESNILKRSSEIVHYSIRLVFALRVLMSRSCSRLSPFNPGIVNVA